ncbi:MAG: putative toxin-antitoxin system toxin component, PIN family [Betaproteobacteria bacterium]
MRVVLDTNVLLSGLAFPKSLPGRIMAQWRQGSLDLVLSDFILEELRRVLPRLSNRHGLSASEIDDLADILSLQVELIEPVRLGKKVCRDPDDVLILGTLVAAMNIDETICLLTGDKDLLELSSQYPIMRVTEFCERHGI